MSKLLNKNCDVCLRRGVERKARTLCDECREFLCKECSDIHLFQKLSMRHTLMDLDPPREEQRSFNEDELASDFLEHAKVSETTVLYRAQVAVEGTAKVKKKITDISQLKRKKITEFSIKRPEDKEDVWVTGVLVIDDKVIAVDIRNMLLKLYDTSGNYQSSTHLRDYTWGITRVKEDMFATCGVSNKVFLWTVRHQKIILDGEYGVDHEAHGIHYNDTYYCVLHRNDNAVTILDRQGRQVRKIVMKEAFGKKIIFGCDIHMDRDTHDIYVSCRPPNRGVLCMSVEGESLWFTPLDGALYGITEVHGALCVADALNWCLHLISKTGKCMGKLLEKKELSGNPTDIYFDECDQKLYVSYYWVTEKRDIISVYSVNSVYAI